MDSNSTKQDEKDPDYWNRSESDMTTTKLDDCEKYRIAYGDIGDDCVEQSNEKINSINASFQVSSFNNHQQQQQLVSDDSKTSMLPIYMPTTIPLRGPNDKKWSMWPKFSSWISVNNKKKRLIMNASTSESNDQVKSADRKMLIGNNLEKEKTIVTGTNIDFGQSEPPRYSRPVHKSAWVLLFFVAILLMVLWSGMKESMKLMEMLDIRMDRLNEIAKNYANARMMSSDAHGPDYIGDNHHHLHHSNHHHGFLADHHSLPMLSIDDAADYAVRTDSPVRSESESSAWQKQTSSPHLRLYRPLLSRKLNLTSNLMSSQENVRVNFRNMQDSLRNDDKSISTAKAILKQSDVTATLDFLHSDLFKASAPITTTRPSNVGIVHKLLPKYNRMIHSLDEYPAHATLWMSFKQDRSEALENLTKNAEYLCGATLIKDDWLVTAAHCFDQLRYDNDSIIVMLNTFRKSGQPRGPIMKPFSLFMGSESSTNSPVAVEALRYVKHPSYRPWGFSQPTEMIHDIALVKLGKMVGPNWRPMFKSLRNDKNLKNISSIEMARSNHSSFIGQRCFVPIRDIDMTENFHVKFLNMYPKIFTDTFDDVALPIISNPDCQTKLNNPIGSGEICAGGELGRDACKGNGGSGLYCIDYTSNKTVLKGIASWGLGCGNKDFPGVYTDISVYRNWIDLVTRD